VHIPFCETKCGYCDFFSVAMKGRNGGRLVERLVRELATRLGDNRYDIRTIFMGGGTPTILPTDQLAILLDTVRHLVRVDELVEYTVEANPATVDDEKTVRLIDAGVTRISMGAQSFFPSELAVLERIHTPDDIKPSVETIRRHGTAQINLDLIFGIPGQTLASWAESLRRAIDLDPEHIACYGLTYEPGTRLTAQRKVGRLTPCDEQLETEMYLCTVETLAGAGYEPYEISNYARPGCRCRHNLAYWRNEPYIGVGPSAAGCLDGRRYKNIADVNGYIRCMDERGTAEAEFERIDRYTMMLEMLMMQLRLVEGLSIAAFHDRTGADPLGLFDTVLSRLGVLGLLTVSETHIALTLPGRLVGDAVIAELACACEVPQLADAKRF